MWTETAPAFAGRHYRIDNARCLPKPTRRPHPPILIGGGGERVLLRLVARHADIWNNLGILHREIGRKLEVLRGHCRAVGRDPAEIEISQQTIGAIALSKDEARRRTEAVHQEVGFLTGAPELCLTGTPDEIIARVKQNLGMGITTLIVSFGRHTGAENVRLFAREVIPAFR
jgi:alkanesulfonate monooxygenase SsuD/methylene tetrahydromethanopterin reductase-like flavin-dependent oxidoreductase (luciferase family)